VLPGAAAQVDRARAQVAGAFDVGAPRRAAPVHAFALACWLAAAGVVVWRHVRAAGVSVEVTRGSRKSMPGAFTMRLRQGTKEGDKVGVFIRNGDRKKHVYGVAPYSLFRFQVNKRSDDLELDLENTAASSMVDAVERALA